MAQYQIPDPEDLVECPYDKVHMVRAKRMPYHLQKCRKNHTGMEYDVCPFNARHELPKPEMRHHVATCPDRAMIEPLLAYESGKNESGSYFKGCTDVPAYVNPDFVMPESGENWDDEIPDIPRIGIDPRLMQMPNRIPSTLGMTRQQKKELNYRLLNPEKKGDTPVVNGNRDNDEDSGERKLRLPHQPPTAYLQPQKPAAPQMSSVFAYSLQAARANVGVGRGQPVPAAPVMSSGVGRGIMMKKTHDANSVPPAPVGRGQMNAASGPLPVSAYAINRGDKTNQNVAVSATNGYASPEKPKSVMSYALGGRGQSLHKTVKPPPGFTGSETDEQTRVFSMERSEPDEQTKVFSMGRGSNAQSAGDAGAPSFVVPSIRRPNASPLVASSNGQAGAQVQGSGEDDRSNVAKLGDAKMREMDQLGLESQSEAPGTDEYDAGESELESQMSAIEM